MFTFEAWMRVRCGHKVNKIEKYQSKFHEYFRVRNIQNALEHSEAKRFEIRPDQEMSGFTSLKIGAHVHFHYPVTKDDVLTVLNRIQGLNHVAITYTSQAREAIISLGHEIAKAHRGIEIEEISADFAKSDVEGFLHAISKSRISTMDIIAKVHFKRPPYRSIGTSEYWTNSILDSITAVLSMQRCHLAQTFKIENVGLAYPIDWAGSTEAWGRNRKKVEELIDQFGVARPKKLIFPMGSIFLISGSYCRRLRSLGILDDLPVMEGRSNRDGGLGHVLERLIGSIGSSLGFCTLLLDGDSNPIVSIQNS
jgi:lipopolysaccharide biosynthesis protein